MTRLAATIITVILRRQSLAATIITVILRRQSLAATIITVILRRQSPDSRDIAWEGHDCCGGDDSPSVLSEIIDNIH